MLYRHMKGAWVLIIKEHFKLPHQATVSKSCKFLFFIFHQPFKIQDEVPSESRNNCSEAETHEVKLLPVNQESIKPGMP
jgi:hypothetical protein